METTRKDYWSCKDTAKLVREAVKAQFPGVKFSVRSDTYSGGARIDVSWTDGPTSEQVDAVVQLYRGADFDGMTDSKSYLSTLLAGPDGEVRHVHFGADFIFTHRGFSPELLELASQSDLVKPGGDDGVCDQCRLSFHGGFYVDRNHGGFFRVCSRDHAARFAAQQISR